MLPQSPNLVRKQQPISVYSCSPSFMLPALQGPRRLKERW